MNGATKGWTQPKKPSGLPKLPAPAPPPTPRPADMAPVEEVAADTGLPLEEQRHRKLLRMLGHVKDAIASRLDELPTRRDLYRALALAGYNSSPNRTVSGADPTLKALWARDDAEALLALGSEEEV